MGKHVMFRSDAMAGTVMGQYLVSLRMSADMDNGMLVGVGALETGEREVKAVKAIAATTKIGEMAILGSEEVDKEKTFDTVGEFTNKSGSIARGYVLHAGDVYAVTEGAFDGGVPTAGAAVYAKAASNKHTTTKESNAALGTCEAVETDGATTWYVIRVGA